MDGDDREVFPYAGITGVTENAGPVIVCLYFTLQTTGQKKETLLVHD